MIVKLIWINGRILALGLKWKPHAILHDTSPFYILHDYWFELKWFRHNLLVDIIESSWVLFSYWNKVETVDTVLKFTG
jgi:hypothetical protein